MYTNYGKEKTNVEKERRANMYTNKAFLEVHAAINFGDFYSLDCGRRANCYEQQIIIYVLPVVVKNYYKETYFMQSLEAL